MLFVWIDTLVTQPISNINTISIIGTFKEIDKEVHRGCVSYDIFIKEKQQYYKILPDWVDCFDANGFKNNVNKGQIIKITFRADNGVRNADMPEITSLSINDKEYMSTACTNEAITKNKINISLLLLAFFLIGTVWWWYMKRYS